MDPDADVRSVLDSLDEGCQIIGFDWTYLYVNDAVVAQGRLAREQLLGRTMSQCYPGIEETPMFVVLRRCMTERKPQRMENEFTYADGSRGLFVLRFVPVTEGVCILSTDVTERRRAQEDLQRGRVERRDLAEQLRQAQKLEAIGRLAGGIAHDFNNLLTVVETYTSFLLDQFHEGDPAREDLQVIRDAGRRGAVLTNQLLAFGRRQVQKLATFDVNEPLRDLARMFGRLLGEDIEVVLQLGEPAYIRADRGQLEQIVMNLVVNARDAMPRGGRLTVETQAVELDEEYAAAHVGVVPGRYVMLAVTDTGTGMDAVTRSRVFEPFFTTKEEGKGTGLGLATVYGIVKQHEGNVWLYSELGHGTTFKVYLPEVDPAVMTGRITPQRPSRPPAGGGRETILLVEDEAVVRRAAVRALRRAGYTIIEAENPGDAIMTLRRHADTVVHLLLTDVVMPKMSGRELAEQVGAMRPDLKVLYMSGYTDDAIVRNGVLEQGTPYLQKPFSIEGLLSAVRDVLGAPGPGEGGS